MMAAVWLGPCWKEVNIAVAAIAKVATIALVINLLLIIMLRGVSCNFVT